MPRDQSWCTLTSLAPATAVSPCCWPGCPSPPPNTHEASPVAPLLTPAVPLPSPLAGAGKGEGGRGCSYREKLATLHSCCRCLKAGGTTREVVSSLSPEVTKLREMATSGETQQGIPVLDSADWEDPFLFNPVSKNLCVPRSCAFVCVCVCVCTRTDTAMHCQPFTSTHTLAGLALAHLGKHARTWL